MYLFSFMNHFTVFFFSLWLLWFGCMFTALSVPQNVLPVQTCPQLLQQHLSLENMSIGKMGSRTSSSHQFMRMFLKSAVLLLFWKSKLKSFSVSCWDLSFICQHTFAFHMFPTTEKKKPNRNSILDHSFSNFWKCLWVLKCICLLQDTELFSDINTITPFVSFLGSWCCWRATEMEADKARVQ